MKQRLFIGSLAALALMASCSSSNDDLNGGATPQESNVPISFSSYLGKTATSRAGATGVQTTSTLATNGFGLFAYYTDNSSYGTSSTPNFMYNTKVTGTPTDAPTSWTYSPLRYWPNETGTDGNGATSEGVDHLTFFAYAPYVTPTDNSKGAIDGATEGITALTSNTTAGDPKVSYTVAADPAKSVDLLWGVSNTATWDNVTGKALTLTEGLPYLNLIKPNTTQKVNFNFKHALSRLGLTVQGAFDQKAPGGTLKDAKITVAKVEITGDGFAAKGVLNLNNTTAGEPLWDTSAADAGKLSLTLEGNNLNDKIKDAGDGKKAAEQPDGVTATSQSLLKDNTYFMFIPGTATADKPLKVKITYYTTTDDPNLATGYTRVENVITKSISAADPGLKFEAGKAYTLNLVLGMTSVKVTATVADWDTGSSTQVDLPINVE